MSGSTVGGLIGAVVGFFIPGLGPAFGASIGSFLGGLIAPPTIEGPKIGDAQAQSVQPGQPRPVVYGHPAPFAGVVIGGEKIARKVTVKTKQGKGGPTVKEQKFYLTSAIGVCEGPAEYIRIWEDGVVVLDRRTTFPPGWEGYSEEVKVAQAKFLARARLYTGTETQNPDPALEAIHGVGTTPYFRGSAYIVVEDADRTSTRGTVAQYRFEMASCATLTTSPGQGVPDEELLELSAITNGGDGPGFGIPLYADPGDTITLQLVHGNSKSWLERPDPLWRCRFKTETFEGVITDHYVDCDSDTEDGAFALGLAQAPVHLTGSSRYRVWIYDTDTFDNGGGLSFRVSRISGTLLPVPDADGAYYNPETGEVVTDGIAHTTAEVCAITLQEIEEDIADRCGVPADKLNFSALGGIEVPGFLVAQQVSGKSVLEPLMTAFFHDLPEYDGQIIARLRGGPVEFNISSDLLLADSLDDETIRPQAMEFPLKVSVVTQEPEADYSAVPQTSIRYSPDVTSTGEVSIQLAVPFDADTAKQIADKIHKVLWAQAEASTSLSLGPDFTTLIASDPFTWDNRRWLCTKANYDNGQLKIEAIYERASNYSSTAVGTTPDPPTPPTGSSGGPTVFIAMNLPQLRAQDNVPGVYIAAMGPFTGWMGADIYLTTEDSASHIVDEITQASIIGYLADDEPTAGEPLTVRLYSPTDELDNATTAEVAAGQNAAALVTPANAAEIVGFETALQNTAGEWELSDITRGQLATAEVTRLTGDKFVMLEFVRFIPIPVELAGTTLVFRAVTKGTAVDANPTFSLVYDPTAYLASVPPSGGGDLRDLWMFQ